MTDPRAALAKIVSIALAGQSPLPHHLVCKCTVCEMRRIAEDALARSPSPYSGAAERKCATCHAILADGPQPAATYAPTTLPRDAQREPRPSRIEVTTALKAAQRNFMATGASRESDERYEDMADSMFNLFRARDAERETIERDKQHWEIHGTGLDRLIEDRNK